MNHSIILEAKGVLDKLISTVRHLSRFIKSVDTIVFPGPYRHSGK